MKTKRALSPHLVPALLLLALIPGTVKSQDTMGGDQNPVNYGSIPLTRQMEPTTTPFGTVGMSNVISAEPLGAGRLGAQLRFNFYEQSEAYPGTPAANTQATTVTAGAALGLNPYIDGFVGVAAYNLRGTGGSGSGAGSTHLGAQATMPLPEDFPLRMGLQVMTLFGTAGSQINTTLQENGDKGAYGYNYLETRRFTDLMARFAQSLVFTRKNMGVKFHLNEGIVSSFEPGKGALLVTGAGAQFFVAPPVVIGVELSSRTFLADPSLTDPFWVTPSLVVRTPAHTNVSVGVDVSLSKERDDGVRTLEPWRGFASVSMSYDTQAKMREARAEKARLDALEKAALIRKARQAEMDRLAQKRIADSLAVKALQDSVILAATQRALARAQSGRSEAEEQLLGTGMLLMDAVYFETGKSDISINSKPYLNIIAKMLAKYPKLNIEVSGHTDSVGGEAYNMGLSRERAGAVHAYMVNRESTLNGHLSTRGFGLSQPKADNGTEEGRMLNRRIELRILNREALKQYNP